MIRVFVLNHSVRCFQLSVWYALQTKRFIGLILCLENKSLVCEMSVPLCSTTQLKQRNRQRVVCPVITSWGALKDYDLVSTKARDIDKNVNYWQS